LAVARDGEVKEWSFQRRRILFESGAEACLFSGAHPDGLRGPEHDFAWCDELAKWRYPQEAWDNLQLGLRRGAAPKALVTTTPRRGEALKRLIGAAGVVRTGGGSAVNPHLPDEWVEAQAARMGNGLLRRQELDGELVDEVAGALWSRGLIERCRSLESGRNGNGFLARVVIGRRSAVGPGRVRDRRSRAGGGDCRLCAGRSQRRRAEPARLGGAGGRGGGGA
jgi:phage terminase large subunit-like protein